MRSFHTSFGSPIETHTSVWMKSTPLTASFGSSVMVSFAPDCAWRFFAIAMKSSAGHSFFGPQRRTSMPMRHPTIISECPMLFRVSPMNAYLISWIGLSLCSRMVMHVGEHLRRVVLGGQPVEDRHTGVLLQARQRLPGWRRDTRWRRTCVPAPGPCP